MFDDNVKNKVIFKVIDNTRDGETMTLEFDVGPDMHMATFHRLCKYAALAQGYGSETVEEYFGETCFED